MLLVRSKFLFHLGSKSVRIYMFFNSNSVGKWIHGCTSTLFAVVTIIHVVQWEIFYDCCYVWSVCGYPCVLFKNSKHFVHSMNRMNSFILYRASLNWWRNRTTCFPFSKFSCVGMQPVAAILCFMCTGSTLALASTHIPSDWWNECTLLQGFPSPKQQHGQSTKTSSKHGPALMRVSA